MKGFEHQLSISTFLGKQDLEDILQWVLNKIGVPGVYGFIRNHKHLLQKAKES
jgi:hypothetical protein